MNPRMGGRLVCRVTADDVGRRVTLRIQLPSGQFRDIVGVLEQWADDTVRVRRRDDTVAEVTPEDIVASRVVPAAPQRRSANAPEE